MPDSQSPVSDYPCSLLRHQWESDPGVGVTGPRKPSRKCSPTPPPATPYSRRLVLYTRALGSVEAALPKAAVEEVLTDAPLYVVAASLGISPARLLNIVRAQTGMTPTQYRERQGFVSSAPQARAEQQHRTGLEMAELYVSGATGPEIAALYRLTPGRVTQLVKSATGKTPSEMRVEAGGVLVSAPHVVEAVMAAYRADPQAPVSTLAKRAGTYDALVHSVFAAQDPPVVRTDVRRRDKVVPLPTSDELVRLYVEDELSTVDLAARFGVSPKPVARRLKAAGVQLKRRANKPRT